MNTHVKVVGWLWILNGLISVFMLTISLVVFNLPEVISNQQTSLLLTFGSLCFSLPGMIANFVAGAYVLQYKNWARILAIILAILNLILFPIGTILGIYTLWVLFNDETKSLFETES